MAQRSERVVRREAGEDQVPERLERLRVREIGRGHDVADEHRAARAQGLEHARRVGAETVLAGTRDEPDQLLATEERDPRLREVRRTARQPHQLA